YKCSTYYDPAVERGFRYDDPDVGIQWPQDIALLVSDRDVQAPTLREIAAELEF
ncbi:MAG: dTDP-4-dehydrorhamnose 3,5-epimerase family protein, partial [Solirubrobacteraceae bacterium]